MNISDTNDFARAINERNARLTRRANSAVDFIVALIIAALATAAMLHFLEPCQFEGALCSAIIGTRTNLWQRLTQAPRQWYLRTLLASAESDAAYHAETAHLAPQLEKLAHQRADELRVLLIDLDLASRGR